MIRQDNHKLRQADQRKTTHNNHKLRQPDKTEKTKPPNTRTMAARL
jgi:hypothetical protein